MNVVQLSSRISYLPGSLEPLSADVIAVRGDSAWWIYDVGCCDEALEFINSLDGSLKKNIVISHFHVDHAGNLIKAIHGDVQMPFDRLLVGAYTFRHTKQGEVVSLRMDVDDGVHIQIEPVPSSHAKGSLALIVDDEFAFMGDSTYPKVGHGEPDSYNTQLLYEQIKYLSSLSFKYLYLSHRKGLKRNCESVISVMKSIYDRHEKNQNSIFLTRGPG